jgi:alpha-mannosidase
VHVGEPGFGVAVTSTATYGHDIARDTREDGGTTTMLRLSLLRAPRYPDPEADQGQHRFTYVLHPGADIADAVAEGYRTNLPVRRVAGDHAAPALVALEPAGSPGIVIEAVKAADDRSGDLVVRLYESLGARAAARLTASFDLAGAVEADLLERPLDAGGDQPGGAVGAVAADNSVTLGLRPFQIVTVRLRPRS